MLSIFTLWITHLKQAQLKLTYHDFSPPHSPLVLALFFFSILLSGCNLQKTPPYPARDDMPLPLQMHFIISYPIPVMAWTPTSTKQATSKTIRIYIEGDGKAWIRRGRPSSDPTPENRLVHYLMKEDTKTDIAYLGRPCQYMQTSECHSKIWTFERYSKSVVDLMSHSVDKIKTHGNYQQVELIGYSGGATIALLLAARRDDIISVRTVAGNLDPAFTNNLHGVSDMPNAMNPLDFKETLSQIPQVHFYGSNDIIIPDKISRHYYSQMSSSRCITIKSVAASHHSGWAEHWHELLQETPKCKADSKI